MRRQDRRRRYPVSPKSPAAAEGCQPWRRAATAMNPGRLAVVVSGMTMASIERCDTPSPSSTGQLPRDVRVKFESLPVPLRVAARDRSDSGLLIEGDLPWLAVGAGLQVELP